jgi:catechol 2,3-dioxygenase-like lactoylglutathione lyase family enzyme
MEHVGIVVDDLAAAIEFFVELGLELRGEGQVEGSWVERIIALDEVKVELAMLRTPDGDGEIELVKFHSPPTQPGDPHAPANAPGIRHLAFLVEDIDAVVAGLRGGIYVHAVSDALLAQATESAQAHSLLRAYDAIHLAGALSFAVGEEVEFVLLGQRAARSRAQTRLHLIPQ